MVKNYSTSSILTLAPLLKYDINIQKRDDIRCAWKNIRYGGGTTTTRNIRTPKAKYHVEDLAILLMLQEYDKHFQSLTAEELHKHELTSEQVLGIAHQLFEDSSSAWQAQDWNQACAYLVKTSLNSIMWNFLKKARECWGENSQPALQAPDRQVPDLNPTVLPAAAASLASDQLAPLVPEQENAEPLGAGGGAEAPCAPQVSIDDGDNRHQVIQATGSTGFEAQNAPETSKAGRDRRTYCGGCGEDAPNCSHLCDICGYPNHPFCGIGMTAEGHGQVVRCHTCQPPGDAVMALPELRESIDMEGASSEGGGFNAPLVCRRGHIGQPLQSVPVMGNSTSGTIIVPPSMPAIPMEIAPPAEGSGLADGDDEGHTSDGNADDDIPDGKQYKGQGSNPASRANLKHHKHCEKCGATHGNKKVSRCGRMVPAKNADGTDKLDSNGTAVMEPCDYVFHSGTQKQMQKLHRQALLADEARLPDAKKMKYAHVERAYLSLVRKATAVAEKEGLDIFVAVIAPTYVSAAVKTGTDLHRHVEKVPTAYDSSAVACTMLRHSTGPFTRKVFQHSSMLRAMNVSSCNAVHDAVKKEEQRRQDKAAVGSQSGNCNDLGGFLIKLGLDTHLQALLAAGFDLDTLVKGSSTGTAFSISPQQLREHTGGQIPIGSCMKIMQHAEEIQRRVSGRRLTAS